MKLLVLIIFFFCLTVYSQNEGNLWYFGDHAGLDFNSEAPVPLNDSQINTTEGCATVADGKGELVMYTDGITVWNKQHNIMSNGTGLMGACFCNSVCPYYP